MKKSEFDFSIPNRQSYVAILMILYKTINVLFRQLLPAIVVIFIGGSKSKTTYILYFIVAVAVISMVYSLINFFKTYFIIQGGELILFTGVFNKKKMSIPFNKIQTINFEQNLLHQIFSVLRLKVDSAGSEKNEFEFHALEKAKAHALRDLVMSEKKIRADIKELETEKTKIEPAYTPIMNLSPMFLLKVGLTENHIRSGGLVFLFFFWIYQNLQDVGVDVDEYSENMPEVDFGIGFITVIVILFLFVSICISLIRTVVRHYDLQFLRSSRGFKIVSGLFTKREVSALDHKIQHIAWSDNLLRRMIGFKNLSLNQASSIAVTTKTNIQIPGCNMQHIDAVIKTLFGKVDLDGFDMKPIDKRYFIRFTTIIGLLLIIIIWLIYYFGYPQKIIIPVVAGLYVILNRYISYRKKAFGHNGELVYIKGGIFGDKAEILPIYKIQAMELHQSPYQTKHQLCSLSLYTASGRIMIPYIAFEEAKSLLNVFLFKVETDKRKWM
ncbi:MAG: PH domain-containing protein [Saprospiraceae bacterium]|nr:PH domain-containing protein [Saprospiraceae bacterium]